MTQQGMTKTSDLVDKLMKVVKHVEKERDSLEENFKQHQKVLLELAEAKKEIQEKIEWEASLAQSSHSAMLAKEGEKLAVLKFIEMLK